MVYIFHLIIKLSLKLAKSKKLQSFRVSSQPQEIKIKELQNVQEIFISPLFKDKNNKQLNIYKYLKLKDFTSMKDISLGGINNNNIKKLSMINPFGFAAISLFE